MIFGAVTHLLSCGWIMCGKFDSAEGSWLSDDTAMSGSEMYMTSFYFTITTITTVGYGDMSASTFAEQIVCVAIMFIGVIAFSYASGSLTNAILQADEKNKDLKQ